MRSSTHRFAAILCLLFACFTAARSAEPDVSAALSQNAAEVGETLQLQVKIGGARSEPRPPEIAVDGLGIRYLGPSSSTSMRIENGRVTNESHVIHLFSVRPLREGTFQIPALAVEVDGRQYRTQPLPLRVAKGAGNQADAPRAPATLEIVVPKTTAFVGEMIPVEIRLSVDARVRWEPQSMPDLSGEGFTKQKMPEPRQEHGRKDGREMNVLVFRTAITPSKAGKLQLGPVEIPYVALVPRATRNNRQQRSLFDLFDDNVFGDPFFSERQQFRARAEAIEIDVKPLPAAGRPPAFSGAVGQFKFSAEGSPRQVKVGDPVTMKLTITGRGNFDRIEAPTLSDGNGWRTYPPSTSFNPEDDLSTSGTKTFEMAVIPEVKKNAMPPFEFTYFDPATAKYVTLKSAPAPLAVQGGAPPPPAPAKTPVQDSAAPAPAPLQPEASDILGIRYDAGSSRTTFEPLYLRRGFLLAQLIPLAALLVLLATKMRRSDARAGKLSALRQARASLLGKVRRSDLPDAEFLETAAKLIQLDTALASGREPGSVDAAAAHAAFKLDTDAAEIIDKVFADRAELLYAGAGAAGPHLSASERSRMVATIEKLGRS